MHVFTRIVCVYLLALLSVSASANTTFDALDVDQLIVMPNKSGHQDWIDAIENAQTSVHLTIYHLTDATVVQALAKKLATAGKNFDLRIIVDGKSFTGGYQKAAQPLKDAGVQIRGSSPAFSLMHEKAMIIDGQKAFITAINLTNTATNTRDFGIVTHDAGIVQEMESVFEADWDNAANGTDTTPNLSQNNLAWSPNNSRQKLLDFVDSATSTLVIEGESLSDPQMLEAYSRAQARGVKVQIIVPMCVSGNALFDYPALDKLQTAGVATHVMPKPVSFDEPYMHSKMMVVDSRLVYIGSINYSINSIDHARELGVLFTNPSVGQQIMREFGVDWNRSVEPSSTPNCGRSNSSVIALSEASMSLLGLF